MANMIGMDVEGVRGVAKKLDQEATQLNTLIGQMNTAVTSLAGMWKGPDATRFVNTDWPVHKKALTKCVADIQALAGKARTNATAQETTSNSY